MMNLLEVLREKLVIPEKFKRFRNDIAAFIAADDLAVTPEGIVIRDSMLIQGLHRSFVNGELVAEGHNLTVSEGRELVYNVFAYSTTKPSGLYLAPFSSNYTPVITLTASAFAAATPEITSNTSPGYSQTTRPQWVTAVASTGSGVTTIGNTASKASYSILGSVNFWGFGLLTSNVKGGTSGTLVSCYNLGSVAALSDGYTFTEEFKFSWT